jgi:hypothetical protein
LRALSLQKKNLALDFFAETKDAPEMNAFLSICRIYPIFFPEIKVLDTAISCSKDVPLCIEKNFPFFSTVCYRLIRI